MSGTEPQLDGRWCLTCGSVHIVPDVDCSHTDVERIAGSSLDITEPQLKTILETVFGMSPRGLEICLCVMDAGRASIDEIAAAIDASRSTVARHIEHLIEIGILEADERVLSSGGRVTLYSTASPEVVRERFKLGLYHWIMGAVPQVDQLCEDKVREIGEIWTEREEVPLDETPGGVTYSRE